MISSNASRVSSGKAATKERCRDRFMSIPKRADVLETIKEKARTFLGRKMLGNKTKCGGAKCDAGIKIRMLVIDYFSPASKSVEVVNCDASVDENAEVIGIMCRKRVRD